VIKNFIINNSQRLASDDTTSQKTRRDPVAYNSNSSSTTRSRRGKKTPEGRTIQFRDTNNKPKFLQRSWVSYWFPDAYFVDSIGGMGSFVYMINSGVNVNNWVSNFFHFVGFFKPKI
jgi:hypothetical protein